MNQTVPADEVILVNDGSTDDSITKIERFILEHHLDYRILHQKNSGQSVARNEGVKHSTMPFIVFVDSDDYIDHGMIELYKDILETSEAQIVVCDYQRVYENDTIQPIDINGGHFSEMSHHDAFSLIVSPSPVNKCFARELLEQTPFVTDIRYEDLATIPVIMYKANKIVKVNHTLYYYVTRDSESLSTMQQVDDKIFDLYIALDNVSDNVQKTIQNTLALLSLYLQHLLIYNIGIFLKHQNGVENLKHNLAIIDTKFPGWYRSYSRKDFLLHERVIIFMYRVNLFFLISFLYKKVRK